MSIETLIPLMQACPQTDTQSVYEHGIAVRDAFREILRDPPEVLAPWWPSFMAELSKHDPADIEEYHVYHDCGKPLCITYDAEGRRHFPDHANVSADAYLAADGKLHIAQWIRHDMDIHTMSADDVPAFIDLYGSEVLLLTGLAELRANAAMFGGVDSTSYKIKYRHWRRRALRYLKTRFPEPVRGAA